MVITSDDETYVNNNQNIFDKPSFELYGTATTGAADGLPVRIVHGIQNRFFNARSESASKAGIMMRTENASASNYFEDGFAAGEFISGDFAGTRGLNRVLSQRNAWAEQGRHADTIIDIVQHAVPYNATTWAIRGHFITSSIGTVSFNASEITIGSDHITIAASRAISRRYWLGNETNAVLISWATVSGNAGRMKLACYDNAMTRIGAPGDGLAVNDASVLSYTTSWGGVFHQGSDPTGDTHYALASLPANTRYVDVLMGGGTGAMHLKSYQVTFLSSDGVALGTGQAIPVYGRAAMERLLATQAPASGTWAVGDLVYAAAPAAAGKIGWVCVTAGAPGAWKPFGAIDA